MYNYYSHVYSGLSPTLTLHSLCPHLAVGSTDMVVTKPSLRCLGKVGAPASSLGVGPAETEVLGHSQQHQLLGQV